MTKTQTTIAALSLAARRALVNAGSSRQGARVEHMGPVGTRMLIGIELKSFGLIGDGNGLTREGTIVREAIMDQEMADFG